jgi:RNA polymerase sigma-70 factor (ECF subfamily)
MNAYLTMDEMMGMIETRRDEFYRFALRSTGDASTAEDVLSAAVLAALSNRERFVPGTNFRAWMYRILANKSFIANRERRRSATSLDAALAEYAALQDRPEYRDVLRNPQRFLESCGDEVVGAFRRLSAAERSCILLRAVEHFSYKEIASILQIPIGTVMTHLARGRTKLREDLMAYARQEGFLRRQGATVDASVPDEAGVLEGSFA